MSAQIRPTWADVGQQFAQHAPSIWPTFSIRFCQSMSNFEQSLLPMVVKFWLSCSAGEHRALHGRRRSELGPLRAGPRRRGRAAAVVRLASPVPAPASGARRRLRRISGSAPPAFLGVARYSSTSLTPRRHQFDLDIRGCIFAVVFVAISCRCRNQGMLAFAPEHPPHLISTFFKLA